MDQERKMDFLIRVRRREKYPKERTVEIIKGRNRKHSTVFFTQQERGKRKIAERYTQKNQVPKRGDPRAKKEEDDSN